jgi:hypothetical protein
MTKTITPDSERRLHLDKRVESLVAAAPESTGDDLLTTVQVAGWLGVTPQWVELARAKGYGPPFIRIAPQVIRYKRDVVIEWLKAREHKLVSEYGADTGRRKPRKREAAAAKAG